MWEQLLTQAVVREADAKRAQAGLLRDVHAAKRELRAEQRQRWKHWWSSRPTAQPHAPAAPVSTGRVVATISRPLHG